MEKQDERLAKLSGQVNRLQEQNEYKDELINALSDKINGGGGADTPEEDQPEQSYSEWVKSRQPS